MCLQILNSTSGGNHGGPAQHTCNKRCLRERSGCRARLRTNTEEPWQTSSNLGQKTICTTSIEGMPSSRHASPTKLHSPMLLAKPSTTPQVDFFDLLHLFPSSDCLPVCVFVIACVFDGGTNRLNNSANKMETLYIKKANRLTK